MKNLGMKNRSGIKNSGIENFRDEEFRDGEIRNEGSFKCLEPVCCKKQQEKFLTSYYFVE